MLLRPENGKVYFSGRLLTISRRCLRTVGTGHFLAHGDRSIVVFEILNNRASTQYCLRLELIGPKLSQFIRSSFTPWYECNFSNVKLSPKSTTLATK